VHAQWQFAQVRHFGAEYLENGEAQYQLTTNRKCHMGSRMDTWPMTSSDLERSRSWPNYVWGPISRKRLEIRTWSQWSTYRKWLAGNLLVTSPMTSRDPKRSRSWHRYRKMQISRKRWEIEAQYQLTTNRKCHVGNRMDTWPMTSSDLERSRSWPNYVWGPISQKTAGDTHLVTMEHLQEMATVESIGQEMPCGESNGHVTDDVTWPRKATQLYLNG